MQQAHPRAALRFTRTPGFIRSGHGPRARDGCESQASGLLRAGPARLYVRIRAQLTGRIRSGEFPAGLKLPGKGFYSPRR